MNDTEAEASMRLPDGKTCKDCAHIRRCTSFGFTSSPDNTHCDFAPSRFRLPAPTVAQQTKGEAEA